MVDEPLYRLTPGLEITRLPDGAYLLHSDFVAVEMGGDEAQAFVERVLLPLQRQPRSAAAIGDELAVYSKRSIAEQLERLRREGILTIAAATSAHEAAYEQIGLGSEWTRERLGNTAVAIFGLEGHGAHVASFLAGLGVRRLRLVDPFPFQQAQNALGPFRDPDAIGGARDKAAARWLASAYPDVEVTASADPLDEESVGRVVADVQLAIGCFDRGMVAAHQWINRAAIRTAVPALFSEVRATGGLVGPLVIGGKSSCFMCYRMRTVAARRDFDRIMAVEEHQDRQRKPELASRSLLPGVAEQGASLLGQEAVRLLLRIQQPMLVDRVLEYDVLGGEHQTHAVVRVPDCPACGQKKKPRGNRPLGDLLADTAPPGDLLSLAGRLVSARTGILTELSRIQIDPTEPSRPFVYRVHIANHQFLSERDDERAICSGKGVTPDGAMVSALGEGIERYSAARWSPAEIFHARRADVDHETLDPRRLVLYAEEHYKRLPYKPYEPEAVLGWMPARSLTSDAVPWIPAIAALMDYAVRDESEFLFPITSNGLAAGPTMAGAVLGALYEVLERDAFMLTWVHRWAGRIHDPFSHPDGAVRELAEAYRRRGVRLVLSRLLTDHPVAVFAGVALQEGGRGGPAAVVGLGADLDPLVAARKAALEVAQVRPGLRRRYAAESAPRVAELANDPTLVSTLEDHALLYASPRHVEAMAFTRGEPASWPAATRNEQPDLRRDAVASLALLVDHFRSAGQDILYVDLTAEDLGPLGLHCARVILPDYQPIWFGYHEPRLGGTRVRELPVRLGRATAPVSLEELERLPHPLA